MATNASSHIGPYHNEVPRPQFKPYKGSDVKRGTGGYVQIRGVWRTLHQGGTVELLGWGDTSGGQIEDYTSEEQELLKTTL